jgi:hypothetical protein
MMSPPRHVFVLGAGFSFGVNPSMPTLKGLVNPLDEVLQGEAAPMAGVARYLRLKPGDPDADVEMLLTSLASPQPYLNDSENLSNQALFVALQRWLARLIYEREQVARLAAAPWLIPLVERWANGPATDVVTLNYDTLIEGAALQAFSPTAGPGDPTMVLDPRDPNVSWGPSARLLKLHGSIAWFYPGPTYGPTTAFKDLLNWPASTWDQLLEHAEGLVPLLIPPVLGKDSYFDHPLVRKSWLDARSALREATSIYVMGYSLPAGDLQMRTLLAEGTHHKPVVLVDSNPRAREHFARLLYGPSSIVDTYLGPDSIKRFVNDYVQPGWVDPS